MPHKPLICHMTSVHSRYDVRIFIKEITSIRRAGLSVVLMVSDGEGDEEYGSIPIVDTGRPSGRLQRMTLNLLLLARKVLALNASVYHFHDPELIPVGLWLASRGKKVIYDVHEDVPRDILDKHWIAPFVRGILSKFFEKFEDYAASKFSAVCTATPFIKKRFEKSNPVTIDVNNYPVLGELDNALTGFTEKKPYLCYVGGISAIRGIREMVGAMDRVSKGVKLQLAGRFAEVDVEAEVKRFHGWARVDELGWLGRDGVCQVLARSMAGLVLFHPLPNHIDAQPNKMFEYMSAGLPVIASNFPLWKNIVEGNHCGICVDPMNPDEIAAAIDMLVNNPELAEEMGKNGRMAVEEKYNWGIEERKLLKLYEKLL